MKVRWSILVLLLMIPAVARSQGPGVNARQQALQGQIIRNFMEHVSRELGLDPVARGRLAQQLRESGAQRRAIAQSTAQLRRQMMEASRDSTTSDAEFKRLLNETTALRQREEDAWKADQDALSRILTPRQQVRFVFMWLRFNEQVRELALRPPRGMGPRP